MKFVFWTLMILVTQAQAQPLPRERELIAIIEEGTRQEFDELVKVFWANAGRRGTDEDRKLAMDAIKGIVYNKAYAQYFCTTIEVAAKRADLSKVEACIKDRMKHKITNFKITTQYTATVAPHSMKCEMQARLFAAEIEFPPFEFLKDASLYDYEKMNDCYLNGR
jgi:hypothetical protein